MADIKAIEGIDGITYDLRDDYSKWGGNNLLKNVYKAHSATSYSAYDLWCVEDLEPDVTYTIQLWDVNVAHSAKTAAQLGVNVYYCGGNVTFGGWIGTNYFTDGHADHLTITFTPHTSANADSSGGSVGGNNNLSHSSVTGTASGSKFIRLYNSVPSASGTMNMSIGKWKLEKGHKATDWSPCYKDIFTYDSTNNQLVVNL